MALNTRVRDPKHGTHGWVRHVGPVCSDKKQPDRVWLGIEWDDVKRGKHDGSAVNAAGETVRYYECAPGAGSFVKPRTVQSAVTVLEALRERYEPDDGLTGASHILGAAQTSSGQEVKVELVGADKIRARQKMVDLTSATLTETTAGLAGDVGELMRCCPQLVALDLDHSLIASWDVLAQIGAQLALHTLRLGRNPLGDLSATASGALGAAFPSLQILSLNGTQAPWSTVRQLLVELPSLVELYLADNAIRVFGFAEILSSEGGDASRAAARASLERLRVLDLAGNGIDSWEAGGLLELARLPHLDTLILDGNTLSDFDGVLGVGGGGAPAAAGAAASGAPAARFPALRCLALNDNSFASWETLDALDALPALSDLRLLRNPITREAGPRRSRQTLIARIARLARLNNSEVRVRERREVEQLYLKQLLTKVYVAKDEAAKGAGGGGVGASASAEAAGAAAGEAAAQSAREALRAQHPRFDTLLATHPEIASLIKATAERARRAGAKGSGLGSNVVKIDLGSSAVESMAMPLKTKRLLRSMTVEKVKVICAKLFKLEVRVGFVQTHFILCRLFVCSFLSVQVRASSPSPLSPLPLLLWMLTRAHAHTHTQVSKQRLYLHERSHPLPIELDDDERDLDYFGVQDGGRIMMHSIDDDGRAKKTEST